VFTTSFLRRGRRLPGSAVAALLLTSTVAVVTAFTAAPAQADADGRGGDYVALPQAGQLLDTRSGIGATAGVRKGDAVTTFQVLGRAGVPATGVRAVLLDLSIVNSTAATHLRIYPEGQNDTPLSFVNAAAKTIMSNTGIVPIGSTNKLSVEHNAGDAHIVVDVQGYFRTDPGGPASGFVPVTPKRLVDTRNATGTPTKPIAAGGSVTIPLATGTPIPTNAQSIMAEVAVVGADVAGPLVAYAAGATAGASVLDYQPGNTSTNMSLKMGTSGRVTFTNKGTKPIDLVVDVVGYHVANSTLGAGFTPVPKRLYDTRTLNTPIPANDGTIDLQIGGMAGLPTQGVAGVAVNITVTNPLAAGHLKIFPTGSSAPVNSFNQFAAGTTRAGSAILRLGTEGRIRLQNNSTSPLNLIVDLHGWYADPRPVLPVKTFTRPSVLQLSPRSTTATVGPIEYAYTDNLGSLISGYQENPAFFGGVQYTVISNGEAFTGQPALAEQANQRTQVVSQVANGGDVWSRTRATAAATDWPSTVPWVGNGGSLTEAPVVGKLGDGRLVQFGVDSDGRLWHLAQPAPSAAYPGWRSLGDIDLTGRPAVVPVRDGNLQLFATTVTGNVRTATYFASGSLSAWTDLGGTATPGSLAAVVYPGFRLRLTALSDGQIITKAQSTTGVWETAWTTLADPTGGFTPAGAPAAILSPQDGRTFILARGPDGFIHRIAETTQASGTWGEWGVAHNDGLTVTTDPTAFTYNDGNGSTWAFAARDASQRIIVFAQSSNGLAARGHRLPAAPKK
jgi:hypothetical protein